MPPIASNNKLSRRERQIMDILMEYKECSAQVVQQALPDPPSYSAVRALLARLLEKKEVGFRNEGGKYIYFPLIEQSEAQHSALQRLIKIFFKGSRAKAVNALLEAEGDSISPTEIAELERTIARIKRAKSKGDKPC
ncbi:MAG: BlaI/MecI/CopY family transcriptional regulator [Cellvibrionaceae bacterium]|nr:BlaI/MecI/CopY family transcriptional regulator [Cellvibrionaceae bacterium]